MYSRKHRSGQATYVVDLGLINGKRERYSFKTKAEADPFAELKKTERQNQGTAALALPQAVKLDAAKASEILTPHSVSLQEAARYYVRHVIAYRNAPLINKIVEQMLADAEKNDRRDRTVSELKSRLNSFAEGFPNQRLSDLTVEEITAWIDEDEDWSARTRISIAAGTGTRNHRHRIQVASKGRTWGVLAGIIESAGIDMDPETREKVIDAASGLTTIEAENAFAFSVA